MQPRPKTRKGMKSAITTLHLSWKYTVQANFNELLEITELNQRCWVYNKEDEVKISARHD